MSEIQFFPLVRKIVPKIPIFLLVRKGVPKIQFFPPEQKRGSKIYKLNNIKFIFLMFISIKRNICRRANLQGWLDGASSGRPEARDDIVGVRGSVEATANDVSLDVQQLRRADERSVESFCPDKAPQAYYESLARLSAELHAGRRHGLRNGIVSGEKSDRPTENPVPLSDNRRWETLSTPELLGLAVDSALRLPDG